MTKVMSSVRAYGNTPNVTFTCRIYHVQTEGLVVIGSTVPVIVNKYLFSHFLCECTDSNLINTNALLHIHTNVSQKLF
jgi:hypothetical protein